MRMKQECKGQQASQQPASRVFEHRRCTLRRGRPAGQVSMAAALAGGPAPPRRLPLSSHLFVVGVEGMLRVVKGGREVWHVPNVCPARGDRAGTGQGSAQVDPERRWPGMWLQTQALQHHYAIGPVRCPAYPSAPVSGCRPACAR
jgi:hypothetical protein